MDHSSPKQQSKKASIPSFRSYETSNLFCVFDYASLYLHMSLGSSVEQLNLSTRLVEGCCKLIFHPLNMKSIPTESLISMSYCINLKPCYNHFLLNCQTIVELSERPEKPKETRKESSSPGNPSYTEVNKLSILSLSVII